MPIHSLLLKYQSIGYFGASTGAAAALVAASEGQNTISAIVSSGSRPDLAGQEVLNHIQAPTLWIVGENDKQVIQLNEKALEQLSRLEKKKKLVIVPGATHLFEEPGTLQEVARLASGWFECFFFVEKEEEEQKEQKEIDSHHTITNHNNIWRKTIIIQ